MHRNPVGDHRKSRKFRTECFETVSEDAFGVVDLIIKCLHKALDGHLRFLYRSSSVEINLRMMPVGFPFYRVTGEEGTLFQEAKQRNV